MPRKGRKTKIQIAVTSFENFIKHIDQTFLNLIKTKNIDAICYIIKKINQNHARKPKDVEQLMMLKFLQKIKPTLKIVLRKEITGKQRTLYQILKLVCLKVLLFLNSCRSKVILLN